MLNLSKLAFWKNKVPSKDIEQESFPRLLPMIHSLRGLIRSRLWLQILVGMSLGVATGLMLSPESMALIDKDLALAAAAWFGLPGTVFLALIQMIVIPLVTSSIILGIAGGDIQTLRRVGIRVVPYFLMTTIFAVLIGVTVAYVINPGQWIAPQTIERLLATSSQANASEQIVPSDVGVMEEQSLPERIAELIPANPLEAALNLSMFHIVVFAILIGIAIATLRNRKHAELLLEISASILEVSMQVVSWAMWLAPFAVFGLLAQLTIKTGLELITGMSIYIATVLGGLLCLLLFYALIVLLLGRRNPIKFLRDARDVQLLAFSTSSSAAVMPISISTATTRMGIRASIARFLIPLGATVNMDGTALYQVVAAIFLTQLFGIELGVNELVLLIMTTVGASIGAPSTPGVGIVILATIIESIGVPLSGIALIIGVDRILDMSRTAVNVTGDLAACTVMERWLGIKELSNETDENNENELAT